MITSESIFIQSLLLQIFLKHFCLPSCHCEEREGRKEGRGIHLYNSLLIFKIKSEYGLPSTVLSGPYSIVSKSSLQSSDNDLLSVPVTGLQCQCCPLRLEYLAYRPCLTHTLVLVRKWQRPHFHQGCWRHIPVAQSLGSTPLDSA